MQIRWFLVLQGLVHQKTGLVGHTLLHWKPVQLLEQGFRWRLPRSAEDNSSQTVLDTLQSRNVVF